MSVSVIPGSHFENGDQSSIKREAEEAMEGKGTMRFFPLRFHGAVA